MIDSDPTTAAIVASSAERARLVAEIEALKSEQDLRIAEAGDAAFARGYDQAVGEIRDHFRKAKETDVVVEIEKIWMKDKLS